MDATKDSPQSSAHELEHGHDSSEFQESSSRQRFRGTPLYNPDVDISGVDEKKLIRKIDLYLIPWLALLYLLSFLDRTSIGNAKVCNRYTRQQDIGDGANLDIAIPYGTGSPHNG
jgi:hypothetical protein